MTLFKAAWFSRLIFKISRGFSLLCILIDCVTGALNRTDRTFSIWPVHHNHARLNFLDRSAINCKAGRNSCLPLRRLCPHTNPCGECARDSPFLWKAITHRHLSLLHQLSTIDFSTSQVFVRLRRGYLFQKFLTTCTCW